MSGHGTTAGFQRHRKEGSDPCEPCAAAMTRYQKRWRHQRAQGITRLVDSTAAREHADRLHAVGMSYSSIAKAAGLSRSTLHHVTRGSSNQAKRAVVEAILSVTGPVYSPSDDQDETFVPRIGACRRIQALLAIGWTHAEMYRRSGVTTAVLLNQRGDTITVRNHVRVARLYDELSSTPGPSHLSRGWARKRGYLAPIWWDDDTIDDPAHVPSTDEENPQDLLWADFEHLERYEGLTIEEAAPRLGVTSRTLYRIRKMRSDHEDEQGDPDAADDHRRGDRDLAHAG